MGSINLESVLEVVTILGGAVALFLAVLQIVETYLDIGEMLQKRRLERKQKECALPRGVNLAAPSCNPDRTITEKVPAQLPGE